MQPNALIDQLPHRRMEAWKWTDVRRELGNADVSGLSKVCEPDIIVPEGINVSRETFSPKTASLGALAARFLQECTIISIPENFKSSESIKISGLENGHACLVFKLAKGCGNYS